MEKYNIEYSKKSKQDLIGIKQYIKYNLQEPEIAKKLISKIRKEINALKDNPEVFAIIDDDIIKKLEIRKLIVDNYIVFYRIKENNSTGEVIFKSILPYITLGIITIVVINISLKKYHKIASQKLSIRRKNIDRY